MSMLCAVSGQCTALTFNRSVAQIMGSDKDWNIKDEKSPLLEDRQIDLHRGRCVTAMLSEIRINS